MKQRRPELINEDIKKTNQPKFRVYVKPKTWMIVDRKVLNQYIAFLIKYGLAFELDFF